MNDGRLAVIGRENTRMQATGLKTTQPAYNRNLFGALLAVVLLAAVVSALIIFTSGRLGTANPAAAPAPNAITQAPAYAHDLPEGISGAVPSANVYDMSQNRARFLGQTGPWTPAGHGRVLPVGDERNIGSSGTTSDQKAVINPRRMQGK